MFTSKITNDSQYSIETYINSNTFISHGFYIPHSGNILYNLVLIKQMCNLRVCFCLWSYTDHSYENVMYYTILIYDDNICSSLIEIVSIMITI